MRYQLEQYPQFIEKVLDSGAHLYHCPLVYTELANIIEKTEYDIYVYENSDISRKDFRTLPACRESVLKEIDLAWKTINSLSTCLDINLTQDLIPPIHELLAASTLDSYDAFYLKLMQLESIDKLVTDDRDFVNTPLSDLYTANHRVLSMR
jgi:predicted nucleic acid-binding protein